MKPHSSIEYFVSMHSIIALFPWCTLWLHSLLVTWTDVFSKIQVFHIYHFSLPPPIWKTKWIEMLLLCFSRCQTFTGWCWCYLIFLFRTMPNMLAQSPICVKRATVASPASILGILQRLFSIYVCIKIISSS